MADINAILREVHRLRRHARELQAEIDRAPYQLKAHQAKAKKAEDGLREARDALKHLKVTIHDREVTLKTTHQQIAKYERQKDEAGDAKAFEALGHEIDAARRKAEALEDEILEAMTQSEERTARMPDLEAAAAKAKEGLAAFEGGQKERLARLAEELRASLGQLKAAEDSVPADVRPVYQRLVNAYGADALAAVEGQSCAYCHTQITVQQQHEVQTGQFVQCKSCGRGLYLPF
jgi:predicted  nucleic acid-binding Zn-ribbon protein